jgi:hypothetical protein
MLKPLTKTEFTNQEILNKAKDVRIDALFDWEDPFKPF